MIKLAIVSPCYNEEEVLEDSASRLTALFDELVAKEKNQCRQLCALCE